MDDFCFGLLLFVTVLSPEIVSAALALPGETSSPDKASTRMVDISEKGKAHEQPETEAPTITYSKVDCGEKNKETEIGSAPASVSRGVPIPAFVPPKPVPKPILRVSGVQCTSKKQKSSPPKPYDNAGLIKNNDTLHYVGHV